MIRYVVIEHLEPCISPWMLSEYRYSIDVLKDVVKVVFTNVTKENDRGLLIRSFKDLNCSNCLIYAASLIDLVKEGTFKNVIVLDPQAPEPLTRDDLKEGEVVVIGGIMGDYPPKGRTKELITNRLSKCIPRNLGKEQLTIAGVAYVLKRIILGDELSSIKLVKGLKINLKFLGSELEIELPYAFPLNELGEIELPKDYFDAIARSSIYFEGLGGCRDEDITG